ncbi:pyridoxamine kinase [Lachnobacterium bovis]|uniref:pyridoxal kinase n=1 Tax=Lachnobacterium bovis TaxID=140626 RepID=A0A1H9UXK9_9FIRM|nr:pyridoxamine kinase [Lachnobacterium bovis]SES14068.1 pyridoxine kinase [Lachnobacterium bovis]
MSNKVVNYNHNTQKKIIIINDLTGFGKCSLTVEIPIISKLKIQCCPIPTSILSNHTAYESYYMKDMTDGILDYFEEWDKLGLKFEGILTGFLSNNKQFDIVRKILEKVKKNNAIAIVDPVMGDDGKKYVSHDEEMCDKMRDIVKIADIITPNLTEACILLDEDYNQISQICDYELLVTKLEYLIDKFIAWGVKKVVITGIEHNNNILNVAKECGKDIQVFSNEKIGISRAGTGDVFSAIIAADAINKINFYESVKRASFFVAKSIKVSDIRNVPREDGVCFEEILDYLK